jgi:hypothetical protein
MHIHGKTKLGFFPLPLPEAKRLTRDTVCEHLNGEITIGIAHTASYSPHPRG